MNLDQVIPPPDTITPPYDKNWPPNYFNVLAWRNEIIKLIDEEPERLIALKNHYKNNPIDFINHWVDTYDPRNAGSGRLVYMPFVQFQRQAELIRFIYECLNTQQNGLIEKCRDMGATWDCCAVSIHLWLFWEGAAIGWGSRKQELVDRIGDAGSIFEKMRILMRRLPYVFWPKGFEPDKHMTYMKFVNPENGATITGEIGDNIGRGGRTLIYFKDESAHYEHPEAVEAALSENTDVQIDISSVNGLGNVFHRRREAGLDWSPDLELERGKTRVLVLDWRDHPEKTDEWYHSKRKQREDEGLLSIFAQEVDRDYAGAVEGIIIPTLWVSAAIDAHLKLHFDDSGGHCAALDVADEGGDTNALAIRKGIVLKSLEEWGERDTGVTARRAVQAVTGLGAIALQYDSIGVGAGIKAETNRLLDEKLINKQIRLVPWNAGAEVLNPEKFVVERDKNSPLWKDFARNLKAQAWWMLRRRFELTYRAVTDKSFTWKPEQLISLPSTLPLLRKLQKELSQPTIAYDSRMKLLVDKRPEGMRSPNLADAVVMCYHPAGQPPLIVTQEIVGKIRMDSALQRMMQRGRYR